VRPSAAEWPPFFAPTLCHRNACRANLRGVAGGDHNAMGEGNGGKRFIDEG
jgi:hypothetical protein